MKKVAPFTVTTRWAGNKPGPVVSTEQKLALVQLNADEGFLLLDTRFKIITFNHSFQKLWINFAKDICEGDFILAKVPAERLEIIKDILLRVLLGNKAEEKLELSFPDQPSHAYCIRYKPAVDEHRQIIGVFISLTDITTSVNLRVKELHEQLNKKAEELVASNAELERFAYVSSHDLQEPLRMVTSFLQLLEKKYQPVLDETAKQYINYAVDGADRMKRLILDLLDYSRVVTNKEEFIETDMNVVMKQVLDIFGSKIRESGAVFKIQTLPSIKANTMQMIQLLQNLVSNSLKFTTSAPEIEIGYEDKGDSWQFFVRDNGIGIEDKFFDKVFGIFQRLHNRNQFSGTGIGLAICKKIIEKHSGAIWIKSVPGKGTIFFFTIKK